MNDISDLASLGFEDLAQADLFDLVTSTKEEPEDGDEAMSRSSVSPEPEMFSGSEPEPYTHITLINGEQICLRDTEGGGEDWCGGDSVTSDTLDLNYILAAGVVERVSSSSNTDLMDDLDWDPEEVSSSTGSLTVTPVPVTGGQSTIIRPRHTILASQLPLPVPARLRAGPGAVKNTVVISSSSLVSSDTSNVASNNNNSLLRSALIGKQTAMVSANGSVLISGDTQTARTVLATVKTECEPGEVSGGPHVDDILMLSMEGREAVARLKDGASQLFPNTRVTHGDMESQTGLKPASAASAASSSVISIEVDGSGNLVLHKSAPTDLHTEARTVNTSGLDTNKISSLAKLSRKYHRRSKEEPKKESRLLHYCHICNKGFKDKYSVNVHVRTHTGEKPFSCQLCGKCFRQKAHLAKHQQTHASKQGSESGQGGVLSNNAEAASHRF